MNKHAKSTLALLLSCAFLSGPALAADISERLDKMAKDLTKACLERKPGAAGSALAVMEFDAAKDLLERKVNFAVSEILLQKLLRQGAFSVVERQQVTRVLEEQALGLTGVVDMETAVKVGKLIGAKFLVLGSVHKLGRNYQINARIVEVETSEVMAAAFQEMDAKLFEQEARPYLVLVPEKEAIAIFAGVGPSNLEMVLPFPAVYAGTEGGVDYSVTLGDDWYRYKGNSIMAWLGARFYALPWFMLDGAFSTAMSAEVDCFLKAPAAVPGSSSGMMELDFAAISIRVGANYVRPLGKKIRIFAGPGAALYFASYSAPENMCEFSFDDSGDIIGMNIKLEDDSIMLLTPLLQFGAEYMVMDRLGISLTGFAALPAEYTVHARLNIWNSSAPTDTESTTYDFLTWKMPAIGGGLSVSFNF